MSAFDAVIVACEALAKAHEYDVTSDGCIVCDLDYPCFTRLNAEAVIMGLKNLISVETHVGL